MLYWHMFHNISVKMLHLSTKKTIIWLLILFYHEMRKIRKSRNFMFIFLHIRGYLIELYLNPWKELENFTYPAFSQFFSQYLINEIWYQQIKLYLYIYFIACCYDRNNNCEQISFGHYYILFWPISQCAHFLFCLARHFCRAHVDLHKRCGVRTYYLKGGSLLLKKRNAFMQFYQIRINALKSNRLNKKNVLLIFAGAVFN